MNYSAGAVLAKRAWCRAGPDDDANNPSRRDAHLRSTPAQILPNALRKRIFVLDITFGRQVLGQPVQRESRAIVSTKGVFAPCGRCGS